MRLDYEAQTTPLAARPVGQAILMALVWIGGGAVALLALCTFGPAIVEYASAAGLPLAVLAPLVSIVIATWDVGGLMLILVGIHRLLKACTESHRTRDPNSQADRQ
jgi:hypothetical protein